MESVYLIPYRDWINKVGVAQRVLPFPPPPTTFLFRIESRIQHQIVNIKIQSIGAALEFDLVKTMNHE